MVVEDNNYLTSKMGRSACTSPMATALKETISGSEELGI